MQGNVYQMYLAKNTLRFKKYTDYRILAIIIIPHKKVK